METTNEGDTQQGGGTQVGGVGPAELAIQNLSRAALNLLLLSITPLPSVCERDLDILSEFSGGKISLGSIINTAARMVVYDGTDRSGLAGTLDDNELSKNSPNYVAGTMAGFKVVDYFGKYPGVSAQTMLGFNELGFSIVFVRPSAIAGNSASQNAALIMHEMLHSLGFEDDQLKAALGIRPSLGSVEITRKFASDCFGVRY